MSCSEFAVNGPSSPFMGNENRSAVARPVGVPSADERRYLIRTDTHYDPATQMLTALLEIPGVKRRDVRITIGTTIYNHQRQVTVQGVLNAYFPPTADGRPESLRERKYGRYGRRFTVPANTRPQDIDATMEDGVLLLRINCGVPASSADEHEIPIR
uniref:SHSP domain-containing protein n=1 Tax=Mycena chlorophos TaxID=658473 RepID=A0ABQ0LCG4_MYCCL|nr:predicted protein [Mycena chlorophos]